MAETIAFVDGGSHGSPGPAGIGVIIHHATGARVEISECIGARDNNYAEYAALLAALRYAVEHGCTRLRIYSDSEVVVHQINGHYSCQSALLRQIYELCVGLIGSLESFALVHIRREHNAEADALARLAIRRSKAYAKMRRLATQRPAPVFAAAFGD